jgi:hypothetical protein
LRTGPLNYVRSRYQSDLLDDKELPPRTPVWLGGRVKGTYVSCKQAMIFANTHVLQRDGEVDQVVQFQLGKDLGRDPRVQPPAAEVPGCNVPQGVGDGRVSDATTAPNQSVHPAPHHLQQRLCLSGREHGASHRPRPITAMRRSGRVTAEAGSTRRSAGDHRKVSQPFPGVQLQ